MRHGYDAHGYWFLTEGEKYTKYGFHVQKYCKADIGVNTDDSKVQNRISNSVFLFMKGMNERPMIMKMSRKNLDRNLDYITSRMGKPWSTFGQGVKEIKIMTSENPNISLLRDLRMRDSTSRISWWWFDDDFNKKYGPFEVEDTVKILSARNRVNEEDSADKPEEVEPETPEEVIDEIEDNVHPGQLHNTLGNEFSCDVNDKTRKEYEESDAEKYAENSRKSNNNVAVTVKKLIKL